MTISEIFYFNNLGVVGKVATPDDPYYVDGPKSNTGKILSNDVAGVAWKCNDSNEKNSTVFLEFDQECRAVIDATNEFVIVVGERKPHIEIPSNAAVFHQDGSLNHIILPPKKIYHGFGGAEMQEFSPEGFSSLKREDNEIILGIYFNYDWFQIRSYNIFTRFWGGNRGVARL